MAKRTARSQSKPPRRPRSSSLNVLAEKSLAHTDRVVSWTLGSATISFTVIAILTVGGTIYALNALQDIPNSVERRVGTEVAFEFSQLGTTTYIQASTMVAGVVQQVVPPAAGTAVEQARGGKFTIIVSSERVLSVALAFANGLRQRQYDPVIYKIGEFFTTTLGSFASEEDLLPELLLIKDQITPSAYFIDLSRACPFPKLFSAGYFACSLTTWPP